MYAVELVFTKYSDNFIVRDWCIENIGHRAYSKSNLGKIYNWIYVDHIENFEYCFYNKEDYITFLLAWHDRNRSKSWET